MYDKYEPSVILPALSLDYRTPERTVFQIVLGTTFIAILLSGFICGFRVSPIIDDMSLPGKITLFAWGTLSGAFVLISVPSAPASNLVKGAITILSGLSFVADGGAAREAYVFAGVRVPAVQVLAPITGSSDCVGRYALPKLTVTPYPGISLPIKTTRLVCTAFEQNSSHEHQCVRLQVETGKYGIRRMLEPLAIENC